VVFNKFGMPRVDDPKLWYSSLLNTISAIISNLLVDQLQVS
jgi:hypothetical protein